jgi:hypothetical protein
LLVSTCFSTHNKQYRTHRVAAVQLDSGSNHLACCECSDCDWKSVDVWN